MLLASSPSAMIMKMPLNTCNQFTNEYSITSNGSKSKFIHYAGLNHITECRDGENLLLLSFFVGGHFIQFVDCWSHL